MRTSKALVAVAAMALLVSGCEATPNPETVQFVKRIQAAMGELKYVAMRSETTVTVDSVEILSTTEMWMDLNDPQVPRLRGVSSMSGMTVEVVVIGYDGWTRVDDALWEPVDLGLSEELVSDQLSAEYWEALLSSATIEDLGVETRDGVSVQHFRATGGGIVGSMLGTTTAVAAVDIWLDSSDRVIRTEIELSMRAGYPGSEVEATGVSINEYFDFDVPIDIQPPI